MTEMQIIRGQLKGALLKVDRKKSMELLRNSMLKYPPLVIAEELITKVLEEIGSDWEKGLAGLSQVYMSGRICEDIMNMMYMKDEKKNNDDMTIAIAVLEDFHILGKKIVSSILKSCGINVIDLGSGLNYQVLADKAIESKIKILLISTLMLPSALKVKKLKDRLKHNDIKIIVGGAPFRFNENLWKEVDADAFGYNASDAPGIIKKMQMES